jgi:hypothetical protein
MEEGIAGAIVEGGILDVLADDAYALLVAAAEEIGAGVMMLAGVLVSVAVGLGHEDPQESVRAVCRINGPLPALTRGQATRAMETHLAWLDGQVAELSLAFDKSSRRLAYREVLVPRHPPAADTEVVARGPACGVGPGPALGRTAAYVSWDGRSRGGR